MVSSEYRAAENKERAKGRKLRQGNAKDFLKTPKSTPEDSRSICQDFWRLISVLVLDGKSYNTYERN